MLPTCSPRTPSPCSVPQEDDLCSSLALWLLRAQPVGSQQGDWRQEGPCGQRIYCLTPCSVTRGCNQHSSTPYSLLSPGSDDCSQPSLFSGPRVAIAPVTGPESCAISVVSLYTALTLVNRPLIKLASNHPILLPAETQTHIISFRSGLTQWLK